MERLNDIFGRAAPPRRPLPEQNARLGQYAQGPVPERPRAAPPAYTRGEQPVPPQSLQYQHYQHYQQHPQAYAQRPALPPSPPSPPPGRIPGAHPSQGQDYQARSHARQPQPHAYGADSYQPVVDADVEQAWQERAPYAAHEEDAVDMRYGDWENGMYDEPARAVEPERQSSSRAANRIAETYPQERRALVTRELRRPADVEDDHYNEQSAQRPPASITRLPVPHPPAPPSLPPQPPAQQSQSPAAPAFRVNRVTQPLHGSYIPSRGDQPAQRSAQPNGQRTERTERTEPEQLIPAPYISPKTPCPTCKGAGYLRADVPYGHPNFGKPIACSCKERERKERRRLQLQELSNLGELRDKTFESFKPNVSRCAYDAYQVAREYAEEPDGWLVFVGRVGCGKTHLAAAVANQALARGTRVLFSTVSDLLDHLRATFVPNATEVYDHLFQEMREAELLVLDDLGAQQSSAWANEKLFQLLNYRYNSRFPTIITTNNAGLQGIEERIRSRIMDVGLVTTIAFEQAGDYRMRNPRRE